MRHWAAITLAVGLAGCSASKVTVKQKPQTWFMGPRTVVLMESLDTQRTAGSFEIRRQFAEQLKKNGFVVRRYSKSDDSIRYAIEMNGEARKCEEGFDFEWLNVAVVDLHRNETMMELKAKGETEGCFGHVFGEITYSISKFWEPAGSPRSRASDHRRAENVPRPASPDYRRNEGQSDYRRTEAAPRPASSSYRRDDGDAYYDRRRPAAQGNESGEAWPPPDPRDSRRNDAAQSRNYRSGQEPRRNEDGYNGAPSREYRRPASQEYRRTDQPSDYRRPAGQEYRRNKSSTPPSENGRYTDKETRRADVWASPD